MADNLVTVTGNFKTLIGAVPQNARIAFSLSRPGWTATGEIYAPQYIEVTANVSTGAFSAALQTTDDISGVAWYTATIKYSDAVDGRPRSYELSRFYLPDGGPYELTDLMDVPDVYPPATSGNPSDMETRAAFLAYAATANPPIGTVVFAAGYGYRYMGAIYTGGVTGAATWVPVGSPHPAHWGAVCNGVADDTDALRAFHSWCNAAFYPAIYAGVETFAADIDASIAVATHVDFCGARIVPINGIVASPAFATMTQGMFVVEDSGTPLVTATVAVADTYIYNASMTPTASFWTDPGYVKMTCASAAAGPVIASRDRLTIAPYGQPFAIIKDGVANYPLSTSMEGTGSIVYEARANSDRGWVKVSNFSVDLSLFNNAILIRSARNQVEFSGIVAVMSDVDVESVSRIIAVENSAFISIHHAISPALNNAGGGSYVFSVIGAAEVRIDSVDATNGWGIIGGSYVNGFTLSNSRVNRFDVHGGAFNTRAVNVSFDKLGFLFGWGGGFLISENCYYYNCSGITARSDFGGYMFNGSMRLINPLFDVDVSVMAVGIDMATDPVGCSAVSVPLPRVIEVSGMTRRVAASSNNHYMRPVNIVVAADCIASGTPPVAPDLIFIDGVSAAQWTNGWVCANNVDMENMVALGSGRTRIVISNVHATRSPTSADLATGYTFLNIPAKTQSGTPAEFDLTVRSSKNVAIDTSAVSSSPRTFVEGCEDVRRIKSRSGGRTVINSSSFNAPAIAEMESSAQVGGSRSGTTGFTSVTGCVFFGLSSGNGYDLSRVAMGSGLTWSSSMDSFITLPGGVTQAQAMSGFRVGSW